MAWLDTFEARMLANPGDGVDDARLAMLLDAACGWIERHCNRFFARAQYTEHLRVVAGLVFVHAIPVHDVVEIVNESGEPISFKIVNPATGSIKVVAQDDSYVIVTYDGGLDIIPADLKLAAAELAAFWARHQAGVSSISVGGASAEVESFPERVRQIIDKYRLFW